jgi:hypothetical protein
MYFGLPRYIPPRPLGETRVRKHWSTKYILSIQYFTLILHITFYLPCPLSGGGIFTQENNVLFVIKPSATQDPPHPLPGEEVRYMLYY